MTRFDVAAGTLFDLATKLFDLNCSDLLTEWASTQQGPGLLWVEITLKLSQGSFGKDKAKVSSLISKAQAGLRGKSELTSELIKSRTGDYAQRGDQKSEGGTQGPRSEVGKPEAPWRADQR
jgi:hypothetical protein